MTLFHRGTTNMTTIRFDSTHHVARGALLVAMCVAAACAGVDAPVDASVPTDAAMRGSADDGAIPSEDGGALACDGAACVHTASCASGDAAAVFVTQQAPPASMTWASSTAVSLTFTNCSGTTWSPALVWLGSLSPADNDHWGTARVALPAEVPTGSSVEIAFIAYAPPLLGATDFAWQLHDDVTAAAIGQASPTVSVDVTAPAGTATICAGHVVDASGATDVAPALQACIDATAPGGVLELPPGVYRLATQIQVVQPITIRTAGLAASTVGCFAPGTRCATLYADPAIYAQIGIITLGTDATPASNVTIDHIIIDGNRDARLTSMAAIQCTSGNNVYGMNATAQCSNCKLTHMASVRALCGTAMGFQGANPMITGSDFRENGQHAPYTSHQFSDGLTLSHGDGATVTGNLFRDNSDIGFVTGGSKMAALSQNVIVQRAQAAFGGLMLDNFNGTSSGDYTGSLIEGNQIDCGAGLCDYGIELGPHPWYGSANIIGGTVTGNSVLGALQGINASGAGTQAAPIVLYGNTISGNATLGVFTCGPRLTSALNISTDSVVNRQGETSPVATTQSFDGCQ